MILVERSANQNRYQYGDFCVVAPVGEGEVQLWHRGVEVLLPLATYVVTGPTGHPVLQHAQPPFVEIYPYGRAVRQTIVPEDLMPQGTQILRDSMMRFGSGYGSVGSKKQGVL